MRSHKYERWLKASNNLYQVRAYNIKHSYNVKDSLEAYSFLLQKAIDEVWVSIKWVEKFDKKGRRRLIPTFPKDGAFKDHYLRNKLLNNWQCSKHYVDSAIKQAYSILKSWRRSCLKGERSGEKPIIRKRFVRIKETLYIFRDGRIKVSIRPYGEHLEFGISKAWFWSRTPKNAEVGELNLNEKYLTITFNFRKKEKTIDKIAWDSDEKSIDGFNPKPGWIRVDPSQPFHIHRVYGLKRKRLRSVTSKKPSLRRVLVKYSGGERSRARDFLNKITTFLSREFNSHIHGFEGLRKDDTFTSSKNHNRRISKRDWKKITLLMSYKSEVKPISPHNTTKRCSRCGMLNAPKGALHECKRCGLRIDGQLNGAINLYLEMEGLPQSPKLLNRLMKAWRGFTLTGEEADEGPDELKGAPRLMNSKNYACLSKTT